MKKKMGRPPQETTKTHLSVTIPPDLSGLVETLREETGYSKSLIAGALLAHAAHRLPAKGTRKRQTYLAEGVKLAQGWF